MPVACVRAKEEGAGEGWESLLSVKAETTCQCDPWEKETGKGSWEVCSGTKLWQSIWESSRQIQPRTELPSFPSVVGWEHRACRKHGPRTNAGMDSRAQDLGPSQWSISPLPVTGHLQGAFLWLAQSSRNFRTKEIALPNK